MSVCGGTRQASACTPWARPISPPSGVTAELSAMFCDLKGATAMPRRVRMRQNPAVITDLPTSEPVPQNIKARGSETAVAESLKSQSKRKAWDSERFDPARSLVA